MVYPWPNAPRYGGLILTRRFLKQSLIQKLSERLGPLQEKEDDTPYGQMEHSDEPRDSIISIFTSLVSKDLHSDKSTRPSTARFQRMESSLGNTAPARACR